MNDIIEEDEFQERPAQAPPPPPVQKRAPKKNLAAKKWFKESAIGGGIVVLIGGLFVALGILPPLVGLAIVAVQVIALCFYFAAAEDLLHLGHKPHRDALGPQLRARRRRAGIRFVTLVILGFLAFATFEHYQVLGYPAPWKVTDPASRFFNPAKFRFSDYRTPAAIDRAARLMFPMRTPKADVDRVLQGAGRATIKLYDQGLSTKVYCYVYSSSNMRSFVAGVFAWVTSTEADKLWYVFVRYDLAGRVAGVSGTIELDESGSLPYTNLTPTGATEPYHFSP